MSKDLKIIERLEKQIGYKLSNTPLEDIFKSHHFLKNRFTSNHNYQRAYCLNENLEVIGLNLDYIPITNDTIKLIESLNNIDYLSLKNVSLSSLNHISLNRKITYLDLSENNLCDVSFLKKLNCLIELDLSDNNLNDVSFLSKHICLKSIDLSGNKRIKDYSFMEKLKELTSIYLSNNELSDIPYLKELHNLTSLDISENNLKDANFLKELKNLTAIDLSDNDIKEISFLKYFKNLSSLDLSGNRLINEYQFIDECKNLKSLNLSYSNLTEINFLKGLLVLNSLNLSGNRNISDFSPLLNLKTLDSLDLSYNNLKDISFLENNLKLTTLYLRSCNLNNLNFPKELNGLNSIDLSYNSFKNADCLKNYKGLTTLDLSGNKQIEDYAFLKELQVLNTLNLSYNDLSNVSFLSELKLLISIDLSYNRLTELSILKELKSIKKLNLSKNNLSNIKFIKELKELTSLNLSKNRLEDITPLEEIKNLNWLYLSSNKLKDVSFLKELKKIIYVNLDNNPIITPPSSIVRLGIKAIQRYFKELASSQNSFLFEAKLLILGEPGAGKTSLARKLKNEDNALPIPEETTWGIDVEPITFEIDKANFPNISQLEELQKKIRFRLNVWDFAGQDIYHATHRFFLSQRSVYVLVSDERKEDTDFKYWLHMVEKFGKDSPLIIIQNQRNVNHRELDKESLIDSFGNIKEIISVNFACIDKRFVKLRNVIIHQFCNLPQIGVLVPENWTKIRSELENLKENYISKKNYIDICLKYGIKKKETQDLLSTYFHEMGVFLHFKDDLVLRNTVFLKPEWVTKAVYTIVESNIAIEEKHGRLTASDLDKIWQKENYCDKFHDLVQLMKNFLLIYETDEGNEYVMPQLLKGIKPKYLWNERDNRIITYNYNKFMPKGIIWQLIVKLSYYIYDENLVWKQGVVLQKNDATAEIIENYEKGYITIKVEGKQKKSLMTTITDVIDKIHETQNIKDFEKLIPCNCNNCKAIKKPYLFEYNKLISRLDNNRQTIECETPGYSPVDILELLEDYIIPKNTSKKFSFANTRIQNLENQLLTKLELLNEYETEKILESDPRTKLKYKTEINKIRIAIEDIQKEMLTISDNDLSYRFENYQNKTESDSSQEKIKFESNLDFLHEKFELAFEKLDSFKEIMKEHEVNSKDRHNELKEEITELKPYLARIEKEIKNTETINEINKLIDELTANNKKVSKELTANYQKISEELLTQIFDWVELNTEELKVYQLNLFEKMKSSDNWKTKAKLKFGLPLAFVHGVDLSVEHEVNLNKRIKKILKRN